MAVAVQFNPVSEHTAVHQPNATPQLPSFPVNYSAMNYNQGIPDVGVGGGGVGHPSGLPRNRRNTGPIVNAHRFSNPAIGFNPNGPMPLSNVQPLPANSSFVGGVSNAQFKTLQPSGAGSMNIGSGMRRSASVDDYNMMLMSSKHQQSAQSMKLQKLPQNQVPSTYTTPNGSQVLSGGIQNQQVMGVRATPYGIRRTGSLSSIPASQDGDFLRGLQSATTSDNNDSLEQLLYQTGTNTQAQPDLLTMPRNNRVSRSAAGTPLTRRISLGSQSARDVSQYMSVGGGLNMSGSGMTMPQNQPQYIAQSLDSLGVGGSVGSGSGQQLRERGLPTSFFKPAARNNLMKSGNSSFNVASLPAGSNSTPNTPASLRKNSQINSFLQSNNSAQSGGQSAGSNSLNRSGGMSNPTSDTNLAGETGNGSSVGSLSGPQASLWTVAETDMELESVPAGDLSALTGDLTDLLSPNKKFTPGTKPLSKTVSAGSLGSRMEAFHLNDTDMKLPTSPHDLSLNWLLNERSQSGSNGTNTGGGLANKRVSNHAHRLSLHNTQTDFLNFQGDGLDLNELNKNTLLSNNPNLENNASSPSTNNNESGSLQDIKRGSAQRGSGPRPRCKSVSAVDLHRQSKDTFMGTSQRAGVLPTIPSQPDEPGPLTQFPLTENHDDDLAIIVGGEDMLGDMNIDDLELTDALNTLNGRLQMG
eukprot:CFRG7311T1